MAHLMVLMNAFLRCYYLVIQLDQMIKLHQDLLMSPMMACLRNQHRGYHLVPMIIKCLDMMKLSLYLLRQSNLTTIGGAFELSVGGAVYFIIFDVIGAAWGWSYYLPLF